jgi:hypothetical protein
MSSIVVAGDSSGSITIAAPAVAGSGTLTLPVATDTLIGKATTDTLTNKSIAATQLTGTIAAAALPAGSVLQVVNGTTSTQITNSTNVFVTTGLTATITPKFATSKILVLVNQTGCFKDTTNTYLQLNLYRGATLLALFEGQGGYSNSTVALSHGACSTGTLDSPATTSATTYSTSFRSFSNTAVVYTQASSCTSTITLMEIQG